MRVKQRCSWLLVLLVSIVLQACERKAPDIGYVAGVYESQSKLENFCAVPRIGIDPATDEPYLDVQGSTFLENMWLRSWINDYYLWYNEVPDTNPAGLSTDAYFRLLKTPQTTSTGRPKDRFHFSYASDAWFALSQGGLRVGYGISFAFRANTPPREVLVALIDPRAPTQTLQAAIPRGSSIVAIDGIDLINANDQASVNALNAGFYPSAPGESHAFTFLFPSDSVPRTFNLVAQVVTTTPVPIVSTFERDGSKIGYVLFTDHYATSEPMLFDAFQAMVAGGVTDLVLDLRYNGGGFLDIASEVAFMIAGPQKTTGKVFERQKFNDKYPTVNPVTGQTITGMAFHSEVVGFTTTPSRGTPLPSLNLNRVFILSSKGTCSASESIINALLGIDLEVVLVGGATCGKPYAFYPTDNCGTTYFSIQMEGVNDKGFGNYPDGFSPANSPVPTSANVPGCSVVDDFTHELGDPNEGMLAAALMYRQSGSCPVVSTVDLPSPEKMIPNVLHKPEPMMNRILRPIP